MSHHLDTRGASAVEYALLVTGIAAAVIVAIVALGVTTGGHVDTSCATIAQQQGQTC